MLFCLVVFRCTSELLNYTSASYTGAIIHAARDCVSPMLPSPCGENSLCSSQHSKAITRHSNSQKKQSSKLLLTSEFSGVHSEQDKNVSTTEQLPYTNTWHNSKLTSFDSINDDVIELKKCAKNPTTVTIYNSTNITTDAVEESNAGQRQSYVVLVGSRVRTVNTKLYASLPVHNKFMVKQREQNLFGVTKVKLVLKSNNER